MSNWYKICCPVDFSQASRAALEEAADLARRYGSELTLLHVFEPRGADTMAMMPEVVEQTRVELARLLGGWKAEAEGISGGTVHARVETGAAAREIVRFAEEAGCHLIVMGTHGRSGLRRLVIGSVAEKVIREAPCHVLVVRPPAKG